MMLRNHKGEGLLFIGMPLLSASALHYTVEDLTQEKRGSMHTVDLVKRNFVALNIDYKQMGVGGDNSWGARTHPQYTLPAKAYSYSFRIRPLGRFDDAEKLSREVFDLR